MSEKKKARFSAATLERDKTGAETGQATTSTKHDTTAAGSRQKEISDFLGHGQEAVVK